MKFAVGDKIRSTNLYACTEELAPGTSGVVIEVEEEAAAHYWPYRCTFEDHHPQKYLMKEEEIELDIPAASRQLIHQSDRVRDVLDEISAACEDAWDSYAGNDEDPDGFGAFYFLGRARAYADCMDIIRKARL